MTKRKQDNYVHDPVVRAFVRTVLTFGVGVALGLAPFLGQIEVPIFHPLIKIFPSILVTMLATIAPLMMGLVAAGLKFYFGADPRSSTLSRWFNVALIGAFAGSLILIVIHVLFVCVVETADGPRVEIITLNRLRDCGCPSQLSDEDCIEGLTISRDGSSLDVCWDRGSRKVIGLAFAMVYVLINCAFGVVVAILVLQVERIRRAREQVRRRDLSSGGTS